MQPPRSSRYASSSRFLSGINSYGKNQERALYLWQSGMHGLGGVCSGLRLGVPALRRADGLVCPRQRHRGSGRRSDQLLPKLPLCVPAREKKKKKHRLEILRGMGRELGSQHLWHFHPDGVHPPPHARKPALLHSQVRRGIPRGRVLQLPRPTPFRLQINQT